jgi:hypothetical protein
VSLLTRKFIRHIDHNHILMKNSTFTSWMAKTASACLMVFGLVAFGSNLAVAQSNSCG